MNRPYSLDLDGLDGISAIEHPSTDPATVEVCDSATTNADGIVSVAGSNTLLLGIAALVVVGLVGFMVLRMGESDMESPSAALEALQQTPLVGRLQAQAESSSEAMFESRSIKSGENLSEGVPPASEKVAPTVTSTGIAGDFTSNGAFEAGKFVLPFDFNKTVVKDLSASALYNLKDLAERCPHTIRVVGHTCGLGPFSSNLAIARMRAVSVKDLLVGLGLSADRIEVISAGAKKPIASNNTRAGRIHNRRVVVGCLSNSEKFGEEKL